MQPKQSNQTKVKKRLVSNQSAGIKRIKAPCIQAKQAKQSVKVNIRLIQVGSKHKQSNQTELAGLLVQASNQSAQIRVEKEHRQYMEDK